MNIKLVKLPPTWREITCYEVLADGEEIGRVWSERGFSYRGTQGWNRGIRLRDYHPLEWKWAMEPSDKSHTAYSRRDAVKALTAAHESTRQPA